MKWKTASKLAGMIVHMLFLTLAWQTFGSADNTRISLGLEIYEQNKTRSESDVIADLQNPNPIVRSACAWELGCRGAVGAADAVSKLLSDETRFVQSSAAQCLAKLGDNRGISVLRSLILTAQDDKYLALQAALTLAKLGYEDGMALATASVNDLSGTERGDAVEILSYSKDKDAAYTALKIGASDSSPMIRLRSALRLRELADQRSVEILEPLCSDEDVAVRSTAVSALAAAAVSESIPLLIGMLSDSSPSVAMRANKALGSLTRDNKSVTTSSATTTQKTESEWRDWWEANKDKYPPGIKMTKPETEPEK